MTTAVNVDPHYIGHRRRVLTKLAKYGYEQFADYEIVEIMLFLIFKRKDTKSLAKRLIEKFGSLDKILSASAQSLMSIEGIGTATCDAIEIINMLIKATAKYKMYTNRTITCLNDVINYAKTHMVSLSCEEVRIICLNSKNRVIDDQLLQRGSIDKVAIYPREIMKLCILSGTKNFILIHNHPSGDPTPSLNDQYTTNKLIEVCKIMDITLLDHIIIANENYSSFKAMGLIN